MAHKQIQVLLNKPMNRREFLAHVGAGTLAVIGVGGLIRMLSNYTTGSHHQVSGYGSSSYGGGLGKHR